jgi:hypothetical protein
MYIRRVKSERNQNEPMALREYMGAYGAGGPEEETMVRTQIYLTRAEHLFLQAEAERRGEPMAAVIRGFIDEKMRLPDSVWSANPLLDATPEDSSWQGHADGSINHDHYVSGAARKYEKKRGKWALQPPVQE